MSNWCQSYDLCPVCCDNVVKAGKTYCSDECLNDAKRYRRRLDNIVKLFRKAGFDVRFANGVQLLMTMPKEIRDCYPRTDWSFAFPKFYANVATWRESDLNIALRSWLGDNVFELSVVVATVEHGLTLHVETEATLKPVINAEIPVKVFDCQKCGRTLVLSDETFDKVNLVCSDCAVAMIPF